MLIKITNGNSVWSHHTHTLFNCGKIMNYFVLIRKSLQRLCTIFTDLKINLIVLIDRIREWALIFELYIYRLRYWGVVTQTHI